jgi:hypothetical protein
MDTKSTPPLPPEQKAEQLLKQFGKDNAFQRATDIRYAAAMRSFVGTSNKYDYWDKVLDIILAADGSKYPAPEKKRINSYCVIHARFSIHP